MSSLKLPVYVNVLDVRPNLHVAIVEVLVDSEGAQVDLRDAADALNRQAAAEKLADASGRLLAEYRGIIEERCDSVLTTELDAALHAFRNPQPGAVT